MTGFEAVAPYLKDPLVLAGFTLFLFFGAVRFMVKPLPTVTRRIAGIAVPRLITSGFLLALIVIVLGFWIQYTEIKSDTDMRQAAAERRAELAEQAHEALQTQLRRRGKDLNAAQEQAMALSEAVTALAAQKGPGIDAALQALAKGDTAKANVIFQRVTKAKAPNIREVLQEQLRRHSKDLDAVQTQSKALTEAVTALAAQKGPGIDAALQALTMGDTAKAKVIFQRITRAQAPNIREAAAANRHLGALAFLDNTREAFAAYHRATELDPENVEGWYQLGHLYQRTGQLDDAIRVYGTVMAVAKAGNDQSGLAVGFGNLGNVYRTRGDLGRAEAMYRKALAINKALGRKTGMADNYGNLGIVYQTRGDLDRAVELYRKALAIDEALGRKQGMASNYGNLGIVYHTRGDLDRAEAMYRKALAIEEALGRKEGMAADYGSLGIVYKTRGELELARIA